MLYIVPDCLQLYLDVTCKVVNRCDIIIVGELQGAVHDKRCEFHKSWLAKLLSWGTCERQFYWTFP